MLIYQKNSISSRVGFILDFGTSILAKARVLDFYMEWVKAIGVGSVIDLSAYFGNRNPFDQLPPALAYFIQIYF